jgi:DNA polymerase III sliding clamp (beta) subunit (PCNA family)
MQTGKSNHKLSCSYEGEDFSVGLNISQVLKSLQNLEEFFKEINFSFQNDKFLVLKGDETEDYKIVMMPMKIDF